MKKTIIQMIPVTCIIIATVLISFILYTQMIEREQERCWQLLNDASDSVSREITSHLNDEFIKLQLMAAMLTQGSAYDTIADFDMADFKENTIFSRIDMIYPDDTVMTETNMRYPLPDDVSFDMIAERGEHISPRKSDVNTGKESIYYNIPLEKNGEVYAILVGMIASNSLSEYFSPTIYSGRANCCIIDSADGNYIMDNWHDELGNAYNTPDRERLKGYEEVDLKEEIKALKTGMIAFKSNTTGRPLYMYYTPLKDFNWQLAIFVQEDVVLENLMFLKFMLTIAGIVEAILLAIYFAWNFVKVKQLEKSRADVEKQLENSNTLIQCVTELSTDKDINISIYNLLKIINGYFNSECTYILEPDKELHTLAGTHEYVKSGFDARKNKSLEILVPDLNEWLKSQKTVSADECIRLEKAKNERCIAVPLYSDNEICGFVCTGNPKKHYDDTTLLSSVQFFIISALKRQRQREELTYISYTDMLTSLYNRNKYMQFLSSWKKCILHNVGIIYIDLNGLKQINDTMSHDAGDTYIRNAAAIILQVFPNDAYRIGGDEFVVIKTDTDEKDFLDKSMMLKELMLKSQISVSTGLSWSERCDDLEALLKEAELKMYKEKEAYYETHERYSHSQKGGISN